MPAKPTLPPGDPRVPGVLAGFPTYRREVPAFRDEAFLSHQTAQEYRNYMNGNLRLIDATEAGIASRDDDDNRMSSVYAQRIRDSKARLLELKGEIESVRQSIRDAKEQFAQMTAAATADFDEKKETILEELRDVEAQLAHFAEWARQSDAFKSRLADLKGTIHRNRVSCSEGIAETRQNAQAKIEKHRIRLAEAIRQARAESLRLRSGDISDLSTTFLTQSEAHLQSLNSQIESSEHLSEVNQTIDDDNDQVLREVDRLTRQNQELKEQLQKQKAVLTKLKAVRREFAVRAAADEQMRRETAAREREEKRREVGGVAATPDTKGQFKMSQDQEQFITFLNGCATSIHSVMIDLLGGWRRGK